MLLSMYTIKESVKRIQGLADQIKEKTKDNELTLMRNKFYSHAYDLQLALGELSFITSYSNYIRDYEDIMTKIRRAGTIESIIDFKELLLDIVFKFEDYNYNKGATINEVAQVFNTNSNRKWTYNLEDTSKVSDLIDLIKFPTKRDITLFAPDCGDAINLKAFDCIDNLKSYGNAIMDSDLATAKKSMSKVVKGILAGSRIQNNAFDMMYVQPPITYYFDEKDVFAAKRYERTYLTNMFRYIRNEGIMIITMPFYRLYKDVCLSLSKQLKNIRIIKAGNYEFNKIGLVHIIGQKDISKTPREEEYSKLRRLCDYHELEYSTLLKDNKYELPQTSIYIDIFRGSALDMEEVENIIDTSSLMDKIWASQKVEKLDQNIKNPLLPFNIGQLGLVLTSGCLDGIVDEGDGYFHAIKGRVSKYTQEVEVEKENGNIELTETTVNKVEINVLMPDGEYKVLA